MDERMDRVTQKDVMEADLEGIVYAPSDDEGDEDADEVGFRSLLKSHECISLESEVVVDAARD